MTDAPPKPTWDELKELLRWFASAFGAPGDLWRDQVVKRQEGLLIRGWLCALEAFARALLVLLAAELPTIAPTARRRQRPSHAIAPTAPLNPLTDDETEAAIDGSDRWTGVAFALAPAAKTENRGGRLRDEPLRFLPTRRLALRLEALIRVAENPERYAARMARRLRAKPKLAYRVLLWPRPPGCRTFPADDVGRAQGYAWFAAERLGLDSG